MLSHTSSYDDNNFHTSKIIWSLDMLHFEKNKIDTIAWRNKQEQKCDRQHKIDEECLFWIFFSWCELKRKENLETKTSKKKIMLRFVCQELRWDNVIKVSSQNCAQKILWN